MVLTRRVWSAWLEVIPGIALKSQVTEWYWRGWMLARRVDYKDADGSEGTSWFERGSGLISRFEVPRGCLEVLKEMPP
jgi:hypothetical protein